MMKMKTLSSVEKLKSVVFSVWSYMLLHNTSMSLSKEPATFHIMVEWSSRGVGYALFVGHPVIVFCGNKLKGLS